MTNTYGRIETGALVDSIMLACCCLTLLPCVVKENTPTWFSNQAPVPAIACRCSQTGMQGVWSVRGRADKDALAGSHTRAFLADQARHLLCSLVVGVGCAINSPTRSADAILAGRRPLKQGCAASIREHQGAVVTGLHAWWWAEVAHARPATAIPRPVIVV
jgi:hypothetical protein